MKAISLPRPFEKQEQFLRAKTRFIAYGGARGGGKSCAVRMKAVLLCCYYPGIRVLILRRSYPELYENHIKQLVLLTAGVADYRDGDKALSFPNGSRIKFGYLAGDSDLAQYQGVEYDVIFMDEATQFSEQQFRLLAASLRGANRFPKRLYLTCNPGGPGHAWVKRLFVDRRFEQGENPDDYTFIRAGVRDNVPLMRQDTGYLAMLETLPRDLRRAWLDGDWDVFAGQYFPEFSRTVHVVEPFPIPPHWRRYRAIDYGLDMLAVVFAAADEEGTLYVYREICRPGLIVSDAARAITEASAGESFVFTAAPPDLWSRQKDSGRSMAELFYENGVPLCRTPSDRVQGWMQLKEWLAHADRAPKLRIFASCRELIRCLPALMRDPRDPCDAATEPHEITHICDALRYLVMQRTSATRVERQESWESEHRRRTIEKYRRAAERR